ncbi:MAG: hypothetical protein K2M56_00130 [Muribaculaceae bacterium]|nr:hypothetical protein [Muribaculaceae bacterium]
MIEELTKYEAIEAAYRTRLIRRADAEYEKDWGVSFETVRANRESQRDVDTYYSIMDKAVQEVLPLSLSDITRSYINAAEFFTECDWGDRQQAASRKRFLRMIFQFAAAPRVGMLRTNASGSPTTNMLSPDEIAKFKVKDIDNELLEMFFPDGLLDIPLISISWMILFTFDIVDPKRATNERSHDIKDAHTIAALKRMRDLMTVLRDDTPKMGSFDKPLIFIQIIENIDCALADPEIRNEWTPLHFLTLMRQTIEACRTTAIPEARYEGGKNLLNPTIPGIWVDNADNGENRFWIFAYDFYFTFCYSRNGEGWELNVYEFQLLEPEDSAIPTYFYLLPPEVVSNYILNPQRSNPEDAVAKGYIHFKTDGESGVLIKITLEDAWEFPEWLKWKSWKRIKPDDDRHREFREVIRRIYDHSDPQSAIFRHRNPELTDYLNALVGSDNRYIYVYDWAPPGFKLRELSNERFIYECDCDEVPTSLPIFELTPTEENPLYAIPFDMHRKWENWRKKSAMCSASENNNRSANSDSTIAYLCEIMAGRPNLSSATIAHFHRSASPVLQLPDFGFHIFLDAETLERTGILKFTSSLFKQ